MSSFINKWIALLLAGISLAAATARPRHQAPSKYEVFGFIAAAKPNYSNYDWNTLTTLAWSDDPALVEVAHRHGVQGPVRVLFPLVKSVPQAFVSCSTAVAPTPQLYMVTNQPALHGSRRKSRLLVVMASTASTLTWRNPWMPPTPSSMSTLRLFKKPQTPFTPRCHIARSRSTCHGAPTASTAAALTLQGWRRQQTCCLSWHMTCSLK